MLPHHDGGGCDGCDRVNDDGTLARTVCEEGAGCCHTWDISLMYPQSTNVSLPIIISNMRNGQT